MEFKREKTAEVETLSRKHESKLLKAPKKLAHKHTYGTGRCRNRNLEFSVPAGGKFIFHLPFKDSQMQLKERV